MRCSAPPISCTCSSWPPSSTAGGRRARSVSWTRPPGSGRGSSPAPWSRCWDRSCHLSRRLAPARADTPGHTHSTGTPRDTQTAGPGEQREMRIYQAIIPLVKSAHCAISWVSNQRWGQITVGHCQTWTRYSWHKTDSRRRCRVHCCLNGRRILLFLKVYGLLSCYFISQPLDSCSPAAIVRGLRIGENSHFHFIKGSMKCLERV